MKLSQANLRLGTRGSKLAMAQATTVKSELETRHPGLRVDIVPIATSGDKGNRDVLGSFVREIQRGLLEGRVDLALHCLKDVPTQPVDGLALIAHLEREDPRDGLIAPADAISGLGQGARLGTGSVRRTSQLAARRPDLTFSRLVGNIDTRLRKLADGEYDAIILAMAGLRRLGLLETWSADHPDLKATPLEYDEMLPAPGQAVLVVEARDGDEVARAAARLLDHEPTRHCATAERAFLAEFGGGCSVPVAAFATLAKGAVHLSGLVAAPDGSRVLRGTATGESPQQTAALLFEELRAQGALDLAIGIRSGAGGAGH